MELDGMSLVDELNGPRVLVILVRIRLRELRIDRCARTTSGEAMFAS